MQHPRRFSLRSILCFSLAATLALSSVTAHAQQPATADPVHPAPTPAEILTRVAAHNAQRQALLSAYTAIRTYQVDYNGVGGQRSAQIVVRADFHAGEKSFTVLSESGSKMICSRVLRKLVQNEQEAAARSSQLQSMLSPGNYDATLVGRERLQDPDGTGSGAASAIDTWVLDVSPKVASRFTYRGRIWVSTDDDAVVRIHAEPAANPSFWLSETILDVRFRHIGQFWLPASNTALSHIRIGGQARLSIDYGDYTVETKPELAQNSQAIAAAQ